MTSDFTTSDHKHMKRALQLARRGQGRVEPNPMVGCVLVKRGRVVGEGYHRRFGQAHAEVEALHRAGHHARGATAYVTLEPCCHQGKTPPCTKALVEAGVECVVIAMRDPFPEVDGRGIRRLRRAGLCVIVGLLEGQARELNAAFLTLVTHKRPYTILKWAQSIDGKIATRTGDSRWISSPQARKLVHRLRSRVDGILVGVGTVLADNPRMTARGTRLRRTATRIVLDRRLRIPLQAEVVITAGEIPTLVLTSPEALAGRSAKARRLRHAGVELLECKTRDGLVDLHAGLRELGKRRFTNLLVEGGGTVIGSFLDGRLADEAMVFVSPRLIGGDQAIDACRGGGVGCVEDASLFSRVKLTTVGTDLLYHI
ncbi:MAG: bifunctional diaminohydroxyphosphoribosylaminopyrimidine deaminase/5-amino-6-(5-phosphoribosylamino)uracil reductase RibD, partial [Phycisphaerae bacterium]|nr:bifunctional diaminohydroxyphosphoribosylaminopyrimidine deaminase/5-amino-6-(5-phosphoribosylamino)uracil reductase RibD [Phycisphaerae bacterium]